MKPSPYAFAAMLASMLVGNSEISAHGGAYRGPGGCWVPPQIKVPGAITPPRVGGGVAPTPSRPITPGSKKPILLSYDDAWFIWWEYNKDPYVRRDRPLASKAVIRRSAKEGEQAQGPSGLLRRSYVEQTVIPTFVKVLKKGSGNRELITGSLIALARLRPGDEVIPTIAGYLKENQEYAETAALALGISGSKAALPILMSLAINKAEAGRLVRGSRVNYRTRSFALFGLGVWCQQSNDNYTKSRILAVLIRILGTEAKSRRKNLRADTEVAALQVMRLLMIGSEGPSSEILRKDATEFLLTYIKDKKANDALFRCHAISALGGVLGRNEDPTGQVRELLLGILDDRRARSWVQQSAIMSLGYMGRESETKLIERLELYMRKGKDRHSRSLAAIAIGRIAGDKSREVLLGTLGEGRSTWVALGLAVLDAERRRRSGSDDVDKTIGDALRRRAGKRISATRYDAGLAIAIGVQGYRPSAEVIATGINVKIPSMWNGYLAESLGLLGVETSYRKLRKLADKSVRYPGVLSKAATALGQIGDPQVTDFLVKLLRSNRHAIEHAAIAQALSKVGGKSEADRLIKLVKNSNERDLVRGFSAVALGIMGEPTALPWHFHLASGCNYLAQTETMSSGGKGILEIL